MRLGSRRKEGSTRAPMLQIARSATPKACARCSFPSTHDNVKGEVRHFAQCDSPNLTSSVGLSTHQPCCTATGLSMALLDSHFKDFIPAAPGAASIYVTTHLKRGGGKRLQGGTLSSLAPPKADRRFLGGSVAIRSRSYDSLSDARVTPRRNDTASSRFQHN